MAKGRLLENLKLIVDRVKPEKDAAFIMACIETGSFKQAALKVGRAAPELAHLDATHIWNEFRPKPEGEAPKNGERAGLIQILKREAKSSKSPTARIQAAKILLEEDEAASQSRGETVKAQPLIVVVCASREEFDQLRNGGKFQEKQEELVGK